MALSNKTREILEDETAGINCFISSFSTPTATIWYSAIDGEIYSKGPKNPAAQDSRFLDSDIRCLLLKADLRGRPLPEMITNSNLSELDREVEGEQVDYAIRRVLEQVAEFRLYLEPSKVRKK